MGYRRLKDELDRHHSTHVNDKRMLRICRSRRIKSTIKYSNHGCTRQGKNPYYLADNLLNREFKAEKPNQKWLTDVTEFKYYVGIEVKKVYLSAILDLYDRRIVSYVIRDTNDNPLVFDTFRAAIAARSCLVQRPRRCGNSGYLFQTCCRGGTRRRCRWPSGWSCPFPS